MGSSKCGRAPCWELLKVGGISLLQELVAVFKEVWETHVIPANWKRSNIIPIFKARVIARNAAGIAKSHSSSLRVRQGLCPVGQNKTLITGLLETGVVGLYSVEVNTRLHPRLQNMHTSLRRTYSPWLSPSLHLSRNQRV